MRMPVESWKLRHFNGLCTPIKPGDCAGCGHHRGDHLLTGAFKYCLKPKCDCSAFTNKESEIANVLEPATDTETGSHSVRDVGEKGVREGCPHNQFPGYCAFCDDIDNEKLRAAIPEAPMKEQQYRVLEGGEVIEKGDEYFDCGSWRPANAIGVKVGEGGSSRGQYRRPLPDVKEIELSLLIIDLGDSCVVKVEKGRQSYETDANRTWLRFPHGGDVELWQGKVFTLHSFEMTKTAIDALDTPPVPRVERENGLYELWFQDFVPGMQQAGKVVISDTIFKSLCQLTGVEISVYERKGEWKQLLMHRTDSLNQDTLVRYIDDLPLSVWRYTRGK